MHTEGNIWLQLMSVVRPSQKQNTRKVLKVSSSVRRTKTQLPMQWTRTTAAQRTASRYGVRYVKYWKYFRHKFVNIQKYVGVTQHEQSSRTVT